MEALISTWQTAHPLTTSCNVATNSLLFKRHKVSLQSPAALRIAYKGFFCIDLERFDMLLLYDMHFPHALEERLNKYIFQAQGPQTSMKGERSYESCSRVLIAYLPITVRLLTHVLCKPTHFFFHSFIATVSYSLQTSFNSLMKDGVDKYHVWGTPTRSPSRSNSR